jgi:hypothetical protein
VEKLTYFFIGKCFNQAIMGASKSKITPARQPLSSEEIIAKFSHITREGHAEINVSQAEIPHIMADIRTSLVRIDYDVKQLRRREAEYKRIVEANEEEQAQRLQGVQGDILKIYRAEYERTKKLINYILKVRFVLLAILSKLHLKVRGLTD